MLSRHVIFVLALLIGGAAWAGEKTAPFQIPPAGKPEQLVGALKYECGSALAFDTRNRPYMFHSREPESFGYILTLRGGKWVRRSYVDALRKAIPKLGKPKWQQHAGGTMVIDDADALYAVLSVEEEGRKGRAVVLLYSPDLGKSFQVYRLPGTAFLEIPAGHNRTDRPPAIGVLRFRKEYPTRWTRYNVLSVLFPEKEGDGLLLGEPVEVTEDCFGISNHSGGYSFAATTGKKTHVVYAEIPKKPRSGNPTFVATIDHEARKVVAKQFLVNAPPSIADVHSTPVVAVDSRGHLHVVTGAHGQSFLYLRSRKPDDVAGGWTKPAAVGRGQTYATLICDKNDVLHTVYRIHPRLHCQHKAAAAGKWSAARVLVNPPPGHRGYSIFYHRLFIDRAGALYLSFTFWETRTKNKGHYPRALAVSEDGGVTWRLATAASFTRRTRTPGQ